MKIKIEDGYIYIIEANEDQARQLKSWKDLVKWERKSAMWKAPVCLEFLNHFSRICRMPDILKEEKARLERVQQAVDAERIRPADEIRPYYPYPVTKSLYSHQVRAANMALMTFGIVPPEEALK